MREIKYFIFLSLTISLAPTHSLADDSVIYLSTGQPGGLYYPVGQEIVKLAASMADANISISAFPRIQIKETKGAQENYFNVIGGKTDLGIVQSDILLRQLRNKKNLPETIPLLGSIFAIASLFPEYTQILANKNTYIDTIIQLAGKTVYIGKPGSGTEINAKAILDAAGINVADLNPSRASIYDSSADALEAVCKGSLDAAILTSGSLYTKIKKWKHCITLINIDSYTRTKLLKTYPFYGFKTLRLEGENYITLFTRAILIGSQSLDKKLSGEQIYRLTKLISEKLPAVFQKKHPEKNVSLFRGNKFVSGIPIELHESAYRYYKDKGFIKNTLWKWIITCFVLWGMFSVLKQHFNSKTPLEEIIYSKHNKLFSLLLEITIGQIVWIFWLSGLVIGYLYRGIKDFSIFKSPISITIIFFMVFVWVAMLAIDHFENLYSLSHDTHNNFSNMNISDLFMWLVVAVTTGNTGDIFPNSFMGKLATVAIPIVGAVGAILATMLTVLKENRKKDRQQRGLEMPCLAGHIILCGWNSRGARIVEELTTKYPGEKPKNVAIIAELDYERPIQHLGLNEDRTYYLRGMSSDIDILKKAHADQASAFIVLADDKKIGNHNLRSVFTVSMISKFLIQKRVTKKHIVVDLVFQSNLKLFEQEGADRIICSQYINELFMAFSTINPGFSNLITKMLSITSSPVITRINEYTHRKLLYNLNGKSFHEAYAVLIQNEINLLAVYPQLSAASAAERTYPQLATVILCDNNTYKITTKDSLVAVVNTTYTENHISIGEFAHKLKQKQTFQQGKETLLIIDRDDSINKTLLELLSPLCNKIHYFTSAKNTTGLMTNISFVSWSGNINDIEETVAGEAGQINLAAYTRCIVLGDDQIKPIDSKEQIYQDDQTVALVMKIKSMGGENLQYIAEIKDLKNIELFHQAGIHQPIPTTEFTSLVLAKMVLYDGEVVGLLLQLMCNSFPGSHGKQLKKVSVSHLHDVQNIRITGKAYYNAAEPLIKSGHQLVAIITHGGRTIILPKRRTEDYSYQIKCDDSLFVITD